MTTPPRQPLIIEASEDLQRAVRSEAERLNLSPAGYVCCLIERQRPGIDVARFDRITSEIFGRFGPAIRKLGQ